ncbi:MAG: SseB family protein [Actinobacteria bacterium]|nr:SseB family protein [Actinomycetota bacterium]MCA1721620.1 SseB family protein [Actinomycetota bacterium]
MSDDGSADPRLAAALAAFDGSTAARAEVLAALSGARVFVAITATSTAEHVAEGTGLRADSSADMALVSLVASDGERALPAFADAADLKRWRLDVRPVPVTAAYLCRAALDDGAIAVVLGPVTLDERELAALADGYVPVPGAPLAARRTTAELTDPVEPPAPELLAQLHRALAPERLKGARLLAGPHGPVLGVVPKEPLDGAALAALAARVAARLGPTAQRLDLAAVPPKGPGRKITRRGR